MKILIQFFAVIIAFMPIKAKADYFVWADEKTGLTASYPDDWKMINNAQTDDILTVALPSGEDDAQCFIRADIDERYLIYPQHIRDEVQRVAFSKKFWEEYNANYKNVQVLGFGDETGLGKGFASTQMIAYTEPSVDGSSIENRAAIMSITNYYDKTYLAQCSSKQDAYQKYATAFLSFMKTIDMKKAHHELTIGNHPRNFINEGTLEFKDKNGVSTGRY
ncbi:MAG: hypothetical protein DI586_06500 [Micavibrio aeruginosavorus]|uniref:Uncharacterized protein n=1 Tax=Micavibrio aeruginosavorus TaxID=349221 RepID=A0A2W5FK51_9BACT|nr:MAG: hypothetical protein DI586_06500 [Micavibrio aeruginosavorus]